VGLIAGRHLIPRHVIVVLALWILVPLAFSLWVWEPTWDHYFVQYFPPLALAMSLLLAKAWREGAPERALALCFMVAYALIGHVYRPRDASWMANMRTFAREIGAKEYLTFNPVLHVVADTTPACGMIDPMNVYGSHCAACWSESDDLARFRVTSEALVTCLGSDTPVVVDNFAFWVIDMRLATHLLIGQRVVFKTPKDRHRLREFIHFERKKQTMQR
jgi:hypothetical protein